MLVLTFQTKAPLALRCVFFFFLTVSIPQLFVHPRNIPSTLKHPPQINPPGNSRMTSLTIIHYTTKNMTLSPSICPLKEGDSSAFL